MASSGGAYAPRPKRRKQARFERPGQHGIGPDGARVESHNILKDTGRGLPGTRRQRNNPRPKHITAGPRPNRKRHPNRRNAPRRTPDPFAQQINALTRLQYGGQQSELDLQRKISDQQSANMGGWYQNYLNEVKAAQAAQAGYAQGFQAAAYQQANTAATADTGQNQQLLTQQQADAAKRGMTVDPSLAQTAQAGVAARQTAGTQFGGLIGAQGQAQTAYLGNRVGVAAQQGIQAQEDEQRKRARIDQLAMDLKKEIGAFKVKTKYDLQEAEHKSQLEDRAFGLDVLQERNDSAQARRDDRRMAHAERRMTAAERRQRREAQSRIRDRRHDNRLADSKEQRLRDQDLADDGRLNGSSGGRSGDKFTPTQQRNNRIKLRNGQQTANKHAGKGYKWLYNNMVDAGYDSDMARVIALRASKQPVPPKLLRRFKNSYGFVPGHKRKRSSSSLTPRNPDGTPG